MHSDETAHTYPIRDADNKPIGHVHRQANDKWTFKIFGRGNTPVGFYDSKEEALNGARNWLVLRGSAIA